MADNGQDPVVSGAQKASKVANTAKSAAKTVKTVGKAAAKAAAQNYIGAAKDLLKDSKVFRAIISIVLLVCFLIVFILMAVGAAIVAVLNYIFEKLSANASPNIHESALTSGGNYSEFLIESMGHIVIAIPETIYDIFVDLCSSDEDGDGENETDNSSDYEKTMNAAIDKEAFVGEGGAVRARLNVIKDRVKERGKQIENTLKQMESNALGLEFASKLSNGLLYPCLFIGVEGEIEKQYDLSAFDLTDAQALKIFAAYCAQNECSPGEAEVWDILNYIGWYEDVITDIEDDVISQETDLNTMQFETTFADSVLEFASVGQEKLTFDLSSVTSKRWHGTFKPQWWKEEWDQLLRYQSYYNSMGNKVTGDAGNATGYEIAAAIGNHMLFNGDGLDKMGSVPDVGLVQYIYTVGLARLSVSAVTYEGTDAELRERMNALLNDVTNTLFDQSYYELVSGILNSWADWTSSLSSYGEQKIRSFPNAQVAFSYKRIDGEYQWTKAFIAPKDTPAGTYCIVEMSQNPERNYNFQSANGKYAPHLVAQAQSAFYSGKSPIVQHGVVHTGPTQITDDDLQWEIGDPDRFYKTDLVTGQSVYDGTYWVIYYCPCLENGGYATGNNPCICGQASSHNTDKCPDGYTCTAYHDVCGVCHTPCDKGLKELQPDKYNSNVTLGSMGDVNAWHSSSCFIEGHAETDPNKIEESIKKWKGSEYEARASHQWEVYAIVNAATPELSQEGAAPVEITHAYTLKFTMEVAFSPVSVDYLAKNIIGLWPGDIDAVDEIIAADGRTSIYAANHIGNEALRKTWTETISVNPDGSRHDLILEFERENGYQFEYYVDYIKSIAAETGIETTGLFSPNTEWGTPIAQIAENEYAYNVANKLYGGDRYWGLCSAGQTAGMTTANRQPIDDWRKTNSWTTAFVLACAFQACETGVHGGFGNLNKYGIITNVVENKTEEWPITPDEFAQAIMNAPGVKRHSDKTYTPIPGDIVILDTKAGNSLNNNKTWRVGIVTAQSDATFTVIIGDIDNQMCKYTGNYAIGSSVTIEGFSGLKIIEYWTPKYTTTLFTNPTFLNTEVYDLTLETLPVAFATVLVTPPPYEGYEPTLTYLFGYPRFRWSQLPAVLEVLESKYPQNYTAQLRAAVNADDPAWAATEWGKLFSGALSGNAKELQIEIWQELYFKPFISTYIGLRNKFNWGATTMRQDILMTLLSTTDNHAALKSALMPLVENLSNDISDAELLTVLLTDDALRKSLIKNAPYLWSSDKGWIHQEWLEGIRCVMNTLAQQCNLTIASTP